MSCRAARSRPASRFSLGGGIKAELFIVPGKVPLYLEGDDPDTASESAANVGVEISDGSKRLVYVPGAAAVTPAVARAARTRRRCCCSTARCSPTTK